jgi:hypothetical protein
VILPTEIAFSHYSRCEKRFAKPKKTNTQKRPLYGNRKKKRLQETSRQSHGNESHCYSCCRCGNFLVNNKIFGFDGRGVGDVVAPKKVVLDPEDLPHMSATISLMEEEEDHVPYSQP